MQTNGIRRRLPYIDDVRAFTICFVVFFHNSQLLDFSKDAAMPMLQQFTASFIMPMFVLIAGYCGHRSLIKILTLKDLFDYNFKNIKRLYVPSFTVATVMCLLQFEHFSTVKSVIGGFWFLTMLFVVMALASVIWYAMSLVPLVKKKELIIKIAPPILLITAIWIKPLHIGEMMPFFLLGLFLKEYNIIETKFGRPFVYIPMTLFTVALFALLFGSGLLSNKLGTFYTNTFPYFLKQGTIYYWFLRFVLSCSVCMTIIALFHRFSNNYNWFSYLGTMTLSIYMFSTIPLFLFQSERMSAWYQSTEVYDFICSSSLTLYFANTISFIITISFCVLLTRILQRWKITRILFLGEK